jgi:hypothetical protein
MANKFCAQCGTKVTEDSKFCHSCGSPIDGLVEREQVAKTPKRTKQQPRLSFPPLVEEYLESDFREAAAIWKNFNVWQRRIWNEAGRPDLLTYTGSDFEEWIIDNADDSFNFDEFVEDFTSRTSEEPPEPTRELAPLGATSWVVAIGFIVGLLATLVLESNSSFLSFLGNFAFATTGWGILFLIAFAITHALAPTKRVLVRRQMVGLAGWVGISFASGILVLIVAVAQ